MWMRRAHGMPHWYALPQEPGDEPELPVFVATSIKPDSAVSNLQDASACASLLLDDTSGGELSRFPAARCFMRFSKRLRAFSSFLHRIWCNSWPPPPSSSRAGVVFQPPEGDHEKLLVGAHENHASVAPESLPSALPGRELLGCSTE